MTLKEKRPLFLRNLVYSTLKEGQVNVDQNYSIFCVVNTLCEKQTTKPPTTTTMAPSNISTTVTTETTDKDNATNLAIVIAISAVTIVVLLILILLVIMAVILRFQRRKQKKKQISRSNFHMTNPHQLANASNKHPANICMPTKENVASNTNFTNRCLTQLANENVASNKHPSFSSDEGFGEGESPRSVSFPAPHTGNPINDLQNDNETIPPIPTDINPLYTNKHKTKTSKTKHHRNVPLDCEIQWKENETYQVLRISTTKPPSAAPIPDFKSLVTKEVKPENYDDVVGISETTHKAAASHMQPQSSLPDMTKHPKSVSNNHDVLFHNITTSRNVAKSLNTINHNNLPSSQV